MGEAPYLLCGCPRWRGGLAASVFGLLALLSAWDAAEFGHHGGMSDVNGASGQGGSVSAEQGSPTSAGRRGPSGTPSGKRLERKVTGRWVAGVCAGLADYTGLDASLVRVIFAVLTFFGGLGPVAYELGWALIPEEGEKASIAERFISKTGT